MTLKVTAQAQVGVASYPDNEEAPARAARDGSLVVAIGQSELFEQASRGQLFIASTGVAGVAHGTAFGATPPFALLNPNGNDMALVVSHALLGYVSGTLGAGTFAWGQATAPAGAAPAGFLTTLQAGKLTGVQNPGTSTGVAYSAVSLTNTPTILRPSWSYGAFAGGSLMPSAPRDEVKGEFIVMPGAFLALQGIGTAGTSPLVVLAVGWYEVPVSMVS